MNIAVTGYAGLKGSRIIYEDNEYRGRLLERYSKGFFDVLLYNGSVDAEAAESFGSYYNRMHELGMAESAADGGVLSALWRLLRKNRRGGTYSQRSIPVLQQTVEICEMFGLNPYRLHSPECIVWLSEDTGELARRAAGADMPLSVIGFTSKGAAIRRTDTEAESSLRRPEGDELGVLGLNIKR